MMTINIIFLDNIYKKQTGWENKESGTVKLRI